MIHFYTNKQEEYIDGKFIYKDIVELCEFSVCKDLLIYDDEKDEMYYSFTLDFGYNELKKMNERAMNEMKNDFFPIIEVEDTKDSYCEIDKKTIIDFLTFKNNKKSKHFSTEGVYTKLLINLNNF